VAFTITKTIRPNAVWQEMYLQVQKDQRIIITAESLWSPEMRPLTIIWCGPDGIEGRPADVGALVGRIADSSIISVGNYFDFYSPYEGPLFLAMNENPEYHSQAGALHAQIILFDL
jgi:hypothetical protein